MPFLDGTHDVLGLVQQILAVVVVAADSAVDGGPACGWTVPPPLRNDHTATATATTTTSRAPAGSAQRFQPGRRAPARTARPAITAVVAEADGVAGLPKGPPAGSAAGRRGTGPPRSRTMRARS